MKLKRLLACVLTICVMVSAFATNVSANNPGIGGWCGATENVDDVWWSYDANTGELTISGTGAMAHYSRYSEPHAPWYNYKDQIKSVVIGAGVTRIGSAAFEECTALSSVLIDGSVETIGAGAFSGCISLPSLEIQEGTTGVGPEAFYGCTGLNTVSIPDSVTVLEFYAFDGCTNLTEVAIGKGLTSMGTGAFIGCTSLKNVYFAGTEAQWSAAVNNNVVLPTTATVYYNRTPNGGTCGENLTWTVDDQGTLTISGTGDMMEFEVSDEGSARTPWRSHTIRKIVVTEGVTSISESAFAFMGYYDNVPFTVEMADSVTSIGNSAFYHSGLTNIQLSDNLTELGDGVFQFSSLAEITLPEGLQVLGGLSGTQITTLVVPDSVKKLTQHAMLECGSLETLTFGRGITFIDSTMLQKCYELKTIYFTGDAPDTDYGLNTNPSAPVVGTNKLTIYYPANNPTWTQEKKDALETARAGFEYEWIEYIPCKTGYTHAVSEVAAKAATYTEDGNIQHYACGNCGKLFSDSTAENQIADTASVVLPKLVQVKNETAVVSAEAVEQAVTAGKAEVVLPVDELGTAVTGVEIPLNAVETVTKTSQQAALTVPLNDAVVTLDSQVLQTVLNNATGNAAEMLTLQVQQIEAAQLNQAQQAAIKGSKLARAITASMISNGKNIHDFGGGKVTISVPFTLAANKKAENYQVLYVADDGKTEDVAAAYKSGKFVFSVSHFSEYVIVETAAKQPATPVTGDSFAVLPLTVVLMASAAVLVLLLTNKKRLYR